MLKKVAQAKNEAEKDKNFEDIQELITNVQFAYDEGDFGRWCWRLWQLLEIDMKLCWRLVTVVGDCLVLLENVLCWILCLTAHHNDTVDIVCSCNL